VGARSFTLSPNPLAQVTGDVQAGAVLRMNLFDTFRDWHAVEDAEHRERMALAEVRAAQQQVDVAITGAHARIKALEGRRVVLEQLRTLARDNEQVIAKTYQRGDVQLLDLLDAAVARANAEAQVADVDAQLSEARALLRIAVGTNLIDEPGEGAAP
jgi:outer membrane protein TolC